MNSHLVRLALISWCIVFTAVIQGRGEKDDLALLSLVSALFARLSLSRSTDCGFHEISQLGGIAASILLNTPSPMEGGTPHEVGISDEIRSFIDFSSVSESQPYCSPFKSKQQNVCMVVDSVFPNADLGRCQATIHRRCILQSPGPHLPPTLISTIGTRGLLTRPSMTSY